MREACALWEWALSVRQFKRVNSERSEPIRLNAFIALSAQATDCNSILNLNVAKKCTETLSVRLALSPSCLSEFGTIIRQTRLLNCWRWGFESLWVSSPVCCIKQHTFTRFFCWRWLFTQHGGAEAELTADASAALGRVLSRFAIALSLPLTNFASLLTQALNNRCQRWIMSCYSCASFEFQGLRSCLCC
ncbi:50S ribosomal protein L10 [Candidatus Hodgkinia cicadicola]|nr:50S ribosomal protein L10 [Candidatus Hodgkinia cicadicola]